MGGERAAGDGDEGATPLSSRFVRRIVLGEGCDGRAERQSDGSRTSSANPTAGVTVARRATFFSEGWGPGTKKRA
eukprot:scaffold30615_cov64-Phaeocystis_antarctica.AAC.3